MLHLASDIFPLLILYSWLTYFRFLSPVLNGWFLQWEWRCIDVIYFTKFIALVKLIVHVCGLCSLCHSPHTWTTRGFKYSSYTELVTICRCRCENIGIKRLEVYVLHTTGECTDLCILDSPETVISFNPLRVHIVTVHNCRYVIIVITIIRV